MTDLSTEGKTIAQIFNRWPDYFGPKIGACDVVVTYTDEGKNPVLYPSNGCHGVMYNVAGSTIDYVYSSLWCRDEKLFNAAKEYWGFLLSPETSPFREALPNMVRVNDDYGRPLAFGLKSQGVANQYCVPLMMQCRVPQENTIKLAAFAVFREHGFDLYESFFLSEHYYFIDGVFYKLNANYNHAFSAELGINFERMKNADAHGVTPGNTWKAGSSSYTPVNSMWNAGAKKKVWEIMDAPSSYTGIFPAHFKREVSKDGLHPRNTATAIKPEVLIEKLKANRTGW